MLCFFDEQLIEEEKVTISIKDRGFTLGDGVFDTQVFVDGNLNDAHEHFERLLNDAIILGIPERKPIYELKEISSEIFVKNNITAGRWIIRTQITRGIAARGLVPPINTEPTILMRIMPAPVIDPKPIKAVIAQTVRRNEHSPLSKIKSLNYGDNILALIEAKDLGVDEAILLNTEGFVTCASASNIFIRERDQWITPPLRDGVLAGITRRKLIKEKNALEDSITVDRLHGATEIFQCNSVIGLRQLLL